jgi:DNA-binding NtrC family response regulator
MHVCLVGTALMRDPNLLSRLSTDHVITLASASAALLGMPIMATVDAMVLDAGTARLGLGGVVADIHQRHPDIPVVLVDGSLDQLELAEAFQRGIADYFAAPWNVALLVERVEVLGARRTSRLETTTNGGMQ